MTTATPPFTGPASSLQFNTVGWEGRPNPIWRVTTRLLGREEAAVEKQVDIDDRLARLLVTIEMRSAGIGATTTTIGSWGAFNWRATNFNAWIPVTVVGNTEIGDWNAGATPPAPVWLGGGPLTLFTGENVYPGAALNKMVAVRTGYFLGGGAPAAPNPPAAPGIKSYQIEINYVLAPLNDNALGKHSAEVDLPFFVAAD